GRRRSGPQIARRQTAECGTSPRLHQRRSAPRKNSYDGRSVTRGGSESQEFVSTGSVSTGSGNTGSGNTGSGSAARCAGSRRQLDNSTRTSGRRSSPLPQRQKDFAVPFAFESD